MGRKRFKNNLGAIRKLESMIAKKASTEELSKEKSKNSNNTKLLQFLLNTSSNHSKNIT